ncbi:MAG: class I SAM-dependent methyltransferase [Candidatus Aminicenantes bacterium]|nr:class I SAM-dependent methyltransferase [Candidatus Aminicenantes bacterium]
MSKTSRLLTIKECPVCRSQKLQTYKRSSIDIENLSEKQFMITDNAYGKTWELSRCQNCTHVFANPCPSTKLINSLYARIKDPDYEQEASGRGKNFKRILSRLEKIHPEKGVLFDVGAATGILLNNALNRGWHPDGVETSLWGVETAEKKYGIIVRLGNFSTLSALPKKVTAVTMVDIIEHIPDPYTAVSRAYEILKPGGTLCLVTPDLNSLAARITGRNWWHFRPAHLAYFNKKSLIYLLRRAGFQIEKIKRYSWTFSAYYVFSRKPIFKFMIKNKKMAIFWKKIPVKLALLDSIEVYAKKDHSE